MPGRNHSEVAGATAWLAGVTASVAGATVWVIVVATVVDVLSGCRRHRRHGLRYVLSCRGDRLHQCCREARRSAKEGCRWGRFRPGPARPEHEDENDADRNKEHQ